MIVVRIELHSAITRKITEIGRMHIINVGGTHKRGNYLARTLRGRSSEQLDRGHVQRRSEVRDYPRLSIHVWHLVARALASMQYAGAEEAEQAPDLVDAANASSAERSP